MPDSPEVRQVFASRAVRIKEEYDSRLNVAHDQIALMGFGLRAFREDYGTDQLRDLAGRASVRFLLLDPAFPLGPTSVATIRDREELNAAGSIANDVREFVLQIHTVALREQWPLEVRLYQALPMVNIFRIDDDLFWGPYLIADQSRNAPTLLVQRGGLLFDRLMNHFDAIWNDWSVTPEEANLA